MNINNVTLIVSMHKIIINFRILIDMPLLHSFKSIRMDFFTQSKDCIFVTITQNINPMYTQLQKKVY